VGVDVCDFESCEAEPPYSESKYRSRCEDKMFAADLAALCAVCTSAEQSSDSDA